jgi:hypothetical protein
MLSKGCEESFEGIGRSNLSSGNGIEFENRQATKEEKVMAKGQRDTKPKRRMPTKAELNRIGVDDRGHDIHLKKKKKKTYRKVAKNSGKGY